MAIPPLDPTFPLCAQTLPSSSLPAEGVDASPLLLAVIRQAFHLVRSSQGWKQGKVYSDKASPKDGGPVQSLYCPSDMEGKLKKCGWHARLSRHTPSKAGLSFDGFFEGLGTDQHTLNEKQYIPDITEALKITTILPGRAEIWRNSYKLPKPTSNRDFLELVLTLSLPPSPEPFSPAHEEAVNQQISSSPSHLHPTPNDGYDGSPTSRRSFIVVSIPVSHPDAPERPGQFVRGKYCSVEAVWERLPAATSGSNEGSDANAQSPSQSQEKDIEWFMTVQSDTGGNVPVLFQEMAMPSQICKDVPLFFEWARNNVRSQTGSTQAPGSTAVGSSAASSVNKN